jgi:hypothetical protein
VAASKSAAAVTAQKIASAPCAAAAAESATHTGAPCAARAGLLAASLNKTS